MMAFMGLQRVGRAEVQKILTVSVRQTYLSWVPPLHVCSSQHGTLQVKAPHTAYGPTPTPKRVWPGATMFLHVQHMHMLTHKRMRIGIPVLCTFSSPHTHHPRLAAKP